MKKGQSDLHYRGGRGEWRKGEKYHSMRETGAGGGEIQSASRGNIYSEDRERKIPEFNLETSLEGSLNGERKK